MNESETVKTEEVSDGVKFYTPATKAKCRDLFINGKAFAPEISEITGVTVQSIERWSAQDKWVEARELRLRDRAAPIEEQLRRIERMIADEVEPNGLAKLSVAYEKLHGVHAWILGLPRPGVSQTAKPSKSKGKFETPE